MKGIIIRCNPSKIFPSDYTQILNTWVKALHEQFDETDSDNSCLVFFHTKNHILKPELITRYSSFCNTYLINRDTDTKSSELQKMIQSNFTFIDSFLTLPDSVLIDPNNIHELFSGKDLKTMYTENLTTFLESNLPIFGNINNKYSLEKIYEGLPKIWNKKYVGIKSNQIDENKQNIVIHPHAGFGNILFMILNGMSYARFHGKNLLVNYNYRSIKNILDFKSLKHLNYIDFNYTYKTPEQLADIQKHLIIYKETSEEPTPFYKYNLDSLDSRDLLLHGYFHSMDCFTDFDVDTLRKKILENVIDESIGSNIYVKNTGSDKAAVMVHIRRGDYLAMNNTFVNLCESNYYIETMKLFEKSRVKYFIFSDDITFAKEFISSKKELEGREIHYIHDTDTETSFLKMIHCQHFIIANSSYSFMAYTLRTNKIAHLLAPKNWFCDSQRNANYTQKIYPKTALLF
jgi:hypothetical protein